MFRQMDEEKDTNARKFLERNYWELNEHMWLTTDMVSRCLSEDQKVLESTENGFSEMPDFDIYVAGFPCTPWSRLGFLNVT